MKKPVKIFALILLVIAAFLVTAFFLLPQKTMQTSSKPKIAASMFPVADIARQIAGDSLDIVTILPRGASPHTYAASPSDLMKLQGSKAVFVIGHALDNWASDLASDIPDSRVVTVDKGIDLLKPDATILIGVGDGESGADPHYWLSAENGKQIARNITDELVNIEPEKEGIFRSNLSQFEDKMDRIDAEIKDLFKDKKNKKIVTHHDAWQYFTRAYGLDWVGSIEPSPGKSLAPQELAKLQDLIVKDHITTIFVEPQLDPQLSSTLAQDLKLKLITVDPTGSAEDTKTYDDLLKLNAERIAATLE